MAYGYWKLGIQDREAVFHINFRRKPFKGNYAIVAGLETAIEFIEHFKFDESDLTYLKGLETYDGLPLFEQPFLDYLGAMEFTCDVDAMVEGTVAFPYEPILRVKGPILQAQLLESSLLNIINFQTIIATKAARICAAAEEDEVIEFGLRRAQGIDGALSGTRASYVGGCHSTSNVLGGKYFGIPVKGTHAHSWIMAFDDEKEAFEAYANVLPKNCIYLIDTYNTIKGVKKAIEVARSMREKGFDMSGVRIDSGDLTYLSIEVRKLLDAAGFTNAKIMASNELDEFIIRDLKKQGSQINLWGVGTNLITAKDQPALDGVYKLSAIRDEAGKWKYRLKISEQMAKVTNPGIQQVRRYYDHEKNVYDMIYDVELGIPEKSFMVDALEPIKTVTPSSDVKYQDLLVPIFQKGKRVYEPPPLHEVRDHTKSQLEMFSPAIRRFLHPHPYFVGLEKTLYDMKIALIDEITKKLG